MTFHLFHRFFYSVDIDTYTHIRRERISLKIAMVFFSFAQVNELLISRQQAEKVLREHRGDVVNALTALTN